MVKTTSARIIRQPAQLSQQKPIQMQAAHSAKEMTLDFFMAFH